MSRKSLIEPENIVRLQPNEGGMLLFGDKELLERREFGRPATQAVESEDSLLFSQMRDNHAKHVGRAFAY